MVEEERLQDLAEKAVTAFNQEALAFFRKDLKTAEDCSSAILDLVTMASEKGRVSQAKSLTDFRTFEEKEATNRMTVDMDKTLREAEERLKEECL